MRTRVVTIIILGMTISFLLALGLVAILRALIEGEDSNGAITFTVFAVFLAKILLGDVTKVTR